MNQYVIQPGDNFFLLARRNGCRCEDFIKVNPGVDPNYLQIGQIINIPSGLPEAAGKCSSGACAEIAGKGFKGRCDDVVVEVEGVRFKVTRVGEASIPHEVHLILPRAEIRKIEHPGQGVVETSIMLSNINIVNSPRLHGEGSVKIETARDNNTNGNFG
jgi:LysM repeat protein